jgi:serine/threonine-protein kinase MRCK
LQVIIYEITRLKSRHKRLREVLLPAQAQSLDVFSEGRLCVGYQSGFTIYSLLGDQHPLSLVHPDNQVKLNAKFKKKSLTSDQDK